jgi:hypothetical protein
MKMDEKTVYRVTVAPSISEQILRNESEGTATKLDFKRIHHFVQIRYHEVDGN